LANVVLVEKANGKWRMCVDFTDLNKACPKDSFPLPSIDSLVDSASGCRLLSFLDAFSGYNQIRMHPNDESKTAFMMELANYCYKVMPFGLKIADATYQHLMDRILAPLLGRNVQAYVDDMEVTSRKKEQHVADLEELFTTIESGKFLRFMLTERGIEANPYKCAAIIKMRSPATIKEVQQLTERMTTLSRFLLASGDKGYPYFQCLKKNNRFIWTCECEEAFVQLNEYLASPPVLGKPMAGVPLRLYFSITDRAISSVIVQDRDQVQRLIYFISKVLQGPEEWYQAIEKEALTGVVTTKRLRPYFYSFTVIVMTDYPIHKVLQYGVMVDRVVRVYIHYESKGPIKG